MFDTNPLSEAIKDIADKLAYSSELRKLMQIGRTTRTEKHKMSILYALNEGKLKNDVLNNYMVALLSLGISEKGKSRKELIKVVQAGTPQAPKGIFRRLKDGFD